MHPMSRPMPTRARNDVIELMIIQHNNNIQLYNYEFTSIKVRQHHFQKFVLKKKRKQNIFVPKHIKT